MDHTYPPLSSSQKKPSAQNLTTSSNPLLSLSDSASMESMSATHIPLSNSKRPQRSAATKAAEKLTHIATETSPADSDAPKKKTLAAFQLSSKAIPDDAGHIKEALWFHIQMFGRLLQKGAIIGPTPPDLLDEFNRFFGSLEDVTTMHNNTSTSSTALGHEHHHINVARVGLALLPSDSTVRVKQQYRRMQSFMLGFMQATLACYGMRQWNPDFTQPSDSIFNVACRFVVVDTFRQALITRAYAAYKVPLKYADSYDLLSKIYDHIVHFHYAARFRKELDNPGSVLSATELQARLTRRARLSKVRISWLTANKYPSRYTALCQPAATSDDELDPSDSTKKTHRILRRPERSTEAEHWIRRLEEKRIQDTKYRRGGGRQYRRHVPAIPVNSPIETLPQNMPLDYFDPSFFNGLQYYTQQACADPDTIAIPKDERTWFTHSMDERLSDEYFTELYGADVFKKYEFVQIDETNMPMELTD